MLSLAIATTLCIGTLGINEVQAATLHFGNYGTYLVYIATTTNTNTTAGRHGANNRTQLDPAALSEFEIQDTSKSNKVYSSNIIWLKKTANDLLMTYSRETSVGKFDSSLSSTKNWTFSQHSKKMHKKQHKAPSDSLERHQQSNNSAIKV